MKEDELVAEEQIPEGAVATVETTRPRFRLPKFNPPNIQVPKIDLPKFDLKDRKTRLVLLGTGGMTTLILGTIGFLVLRDNLPITSSIKVPSLTPTRFIPTTIAIGIPAPADFAPATPPASITPPARTRIPEATTTPLPTPTPVEKQTAVLKKRQGAMDAIRQGYLSNHPNLSASERAELEKTLNDPALWLKVFELNKDNTNFWSQAKGIIDGLLASPRLSFADRLRLAEIKAIYDRLGYNNGAFTNMEDAQREQNLRTIFDYIPDDGASLEYPKLP